MDLGVRDRGYLVFGGSAGIGRAAAEVLAADGARVALVGRGRERCEEAAAAISEATGATVVALAGDLTEEGEAERLVEAAVERLGGLRGMAVTTGLGIRGHRDLQTATDDDWRATFDDVLLATAGVPGHHPRPRRRRRGVGRDDRGVLHPRPKAHQVAYAALKAGVATMTKALAKAHGADGVRISCVCPGATETDVLASLRPGIAEERGWPVEEALERVMAEEWGMDVALGRLGRPEELGDVIAYLLSERSSYVTGATVNVDGGTDF